MGGYNHALVGGYNGFDPGGNPMHIEAWLPAKWNGRFQGSGGGGYSCGINGYTGAYAEMAPAIRGRSATAATDCGHSGSPLDGSFALRPDKTLNWPLINDFAYAGIHDMSVDGKALTQVYYPSPLRHSYFFGCSTGGREGLMEAQRYPADYNGIVSGAPAINWTRFIQAEIWPELVMNQSHDFLPSHFHDDQAARCQPYAELDDLHSLPDCWKRTRAHPDSAGRSRDRGLDEHHSEPSTRGSPARCAGRSLAINLY